MTHKLLKESLSTIKILSRDHNHFTNDCCICLQYQDDNKMKPISIERRSGLDSMQYIERDYACIECLTTHAHAFLKGML
jgi:hypothetical protein